MPGDMGSPRSTAAAAARPASPQVQRLSSPESLDLASRVRVGEEREMGGGEEQVEQGTLIPGMMMMMRKTRAGDAVKAEGEHGVGAGRRVHRDRRRRGAQAQEGRGQVHTQARTLFAPTHLTAPQAHHRRSLSLPISRPTQANFRTPFRVTQVCQQHMLSSHHGHLHFQPVGFLSIQTLFWVPGWVREIWVIRSRHLVTVSTVCFPTRIDSLTSIVFFPYQGSPTSSPLMG